MTAADLEDRIGNIFVQHLHVQAPSPDIDLIENGVIDSLAFVELLAQLEQEFSVRIPLEDIDLNHFRSIVRIGEFIETLIPKDEVRIGSHSRV